MEISKDEVLTNLQIEVIAEENLSPQQKEEIETLAKEIFKNVPQEEVEEDFYNPEFARVIAKLNGEIVGYAGLHKSETEYKRQKIVIGGYGGVLTRPDMRGKGIATQVCAKALEVLKNQGLDIAFLSIDTDTTTHQLYEKMGFKLMKQKFRWKNSKGEIKSDMGGMVALLNSPDKFKLVLEGSDPFYVGKGYW